MTNSAVLIITGASSGIGAATARLFASTGYRVVLAARRLELLEALAREIQSKGGEALPVQTDMADLAQIERLVEMTLAEYGQIDILLNNAGFGRLTWLEELDPKGDVAAQIQVNLTGVIQLTQAVLPHLIARRSGHIINIASIAGLVATPTYSVYAASKFGLRGFTDALRREVGIHGIRVTGIYPGGVANEFGQKAGIKRKTGLSTPKTLKLTSEEVAREVLRAAKIPRRLIVIPRVMWLSIWANALFPGLVDWVIERNFTRPERMGQ